LKQRIKTALDEHDMKLVDLAHDENLRDVPLVLLFKALKKFLSNKDYTQFKHQCMKKFFKYALASEVYALKTKKSSKIKQINS